MKKSKVLNGLNLKKIQGFNWLVFEKIQGIHRARLFGEAFDHDKKGFISRQKRFHLTIKKACAREKKGVRS